jgi:protocatechuate 3,4-dioxygenase beta subunit
MPGVSWTHDIASFGMVSGAAWSMTSSDILIAVAILLLFGEMLKATGRHPNRPAHVHFLIAAKGHETLITHVFAADSP